MNSVNVTKIQMFNILNKQNVTLILPLFKYLFKIDFFFFFAIRYLISLSLFTIAPALVPIEMKCSTAQSQIAAISNENCNNLNNNNTATANSHPTSNSISGIVDGTGIMTQINPTPILQQQTNHIANMNVSSPSENHHNKSPLTGATSTGPSTTVHCGACMQPICDRYIMKVVETAYHERCLQCISCCCNLINTCYQRDNKLFCRKDYER